jgi:uncharacterized protein with HEPN domain
MAERIISPNLIDLVEAIDRIRASLTGLSLEDFENSWEKRWLVERGIEIISEASRRLPGDLKDRNPGIPWRKVAGIGNIIRHDYERVAPDVLWKFDPGRFADARKSVPGRIVGGVGPRTGGRRGLKPAVMAPISYPAAIAASLATVFMLRAVPSPAAGMRNLERPIPSG